MKEIKEGKISKIANNKVFEKKDVFIYVLLFVFVLTLFLSMFLSNNSNSNGFAVYVNGQKILSHVYTKNDLQSSSNVIVTKNGNDYLIEILTENGGSNLIYSNETEKSVKVIESNCPSQNCVHMNAITHSGVIYCAPRDILITPLNDNGDLPPVTGGGA